MPHTPLHTQCHLAPTSSNLLYSLSKFHLAWGGMNNTMTSLTQFVGLTAHGNIQTDARWTRQPPCHPTCRPKDLVFNFSMLTSLLLMIAWFPCTMWANSSWWLTEGENHSCHAYKYVCFTRLGHMQQFLPEGNTNLLSSPNLALGSLEALPISLPVTRSLRSHDLSHMTSLRTQDGG